MQTPFILALGFGGSEMLLVLALALLLFGGKKLPEFAKGLGQSIKEFKKASTTDEDPAPTKPTEVKKVEAAKSDHTGA